RVVLDVDLELAAHTTVRADRARHALLLLVPGARCPHVVLAREHERAGRADADAVAAVHARRAVERDRVFGRDPGVESAAGHRDRAGGWRVGAVGVEALVAEDELGVVADVELVVDLHRWGDGLGDRRILRLVVMPGSLRVALPRLQWFHPRAEPIGV